MNNIKNIFYKRYLPTLLIVMFAVVYSSSRVCAASIPTLTLTNNTTSIGISIIGADPNATVNFYFPNDSTTVNASGAMTYTSIDIGQTDQNGSFSVSVAPNSYGLNSGTLVYVSVDGADSPTVDWPTTASNSGQNGSLSLSQQSVNLVNGETTTVTALNTSDTLSVQGNSNPSVASAYFQSNSNSVIITGLNAGSSVISICAGSYGCGSVSATVQASTQAITFSLPIAYVVVGQPAQTVSIYGPGSGSNYSISNSNQNILSTSINGTSLSLQALAVGQTTLSICSPGYQCGSLTVNVVSSGTAIPNQVAAPAPINSDFSQPPQLSSLSISSNDVFDQFFGAGSTININFSLNQTVTNVQVQIFGQQVTVGQGNNGQYSASYRATGNETLPMSVVISYTNPSGLVGRSYFSFGNSSTASSATASTLTTHCPINLICMPTATPVPSESVVTSSSDSSSSYQFNTYLYVGMTSKGQSDPDVLALQKRLTADGFFSGPETGYFGPLTKTAVEAYQTKHGLDPIGVVGPATRNLLNQGV